jgi:DNA-binding FadR family transcriptional regulator
MPFSDSEEAEKLHEWTLVDKDAVVLLQNLAEISQIADDYADGDADGPEKITRLLHLSLVAIPTNPFFMKHGQWLVPVMSSSMHLWNASNDWRNEYGFVYREALEQIIHVVALLTGGQEHAAQVAKDVNKFYHQIHGERIEDWMKEQQNG